MSAEQASGSKGAGENKTVSSGGSEVAAGGGVARYISDSILELKKVSHPTRQETIQATSITLMIVLFAGVCLFILDVLLGKLMAALI